MSQNAKTEDNKFTQLWNLELNFLFQETERPVNIAQEVSNFLGNRADTSSASETIAEDQESNFLNIYEPSTSTTETVVEREIRLQRSNAADKDDITSATGIVTDRELNLLKKRIYASKKRAAETPTEKESRLKQQRIYDEAKRTAENPAEKELRLQQHAIYLQTKRASESPAETESRLQQQRNYDQTKRASESPAETESRLQQQRIYDQTKRASESPAETESRLQQQRIYDQTKRASESPAETESRLQQQRIYDQTKRASESPAETESRLQQQRIYDQTKRASESTAETESRLQQHAVYLQRRRASEIPAETESRIRELRTHATLSRSQETVQEHESRIQAVRTAAATIRRHIWIQKENAAFAYNPYTDYILDPATQIGKMDQECHFCHALKWKNEAAGICCNNGKVRLPQLEDPPETLATFLTASTEKAKHFQNNTRKYNSCFTMTSFGCSKEITERGFMPTFKVQGQVYHRIGGLHPLPNEEPKFLQIYFVEDKQDEAQQRCRVVSNDVHEDIILHLQEMLTTENILVQGFKTAIEKITPELKLVIHADKTPVGEHERRFNAPTVSEVAVILAGEQTGTRDITLTLRDNSLKKIAETHRSYDALQYPLIFWKGEDGYHFELRQTDPNTGQLTSKKISAMDFYAFRIMYRRNCFNIILHYKQLFHQYVVDMYAKIEAERLRYIKFNQKKLRVEEYVHLRDAINNDVQVQDLGQLIILPSSFTGGPRYMHERTQDAMTYVRNFGRPDLFITFTCNPKWEEIPAELLEGQKATDRHDLLARVFRQKLKKMMDLINKGKIFGAVSCFMYSIEWQKRGLPHAHILLWMKQKIHVHRVDEFISAEIPNPDIDPVLNDTVTKQMIHGPCGVLNPGSPCMKEGRCTKRYPRNFLEETHTGTDGYPLYRRKSPEDGGFTAVVKTKGTEFQVDNRWVVPFCPLLSKIFNAHINVEMCSSVKSIKYVCKYVNKGSDMALFTLEGDVNSRDEVNTYEAGRYISSNEAIWRILNFPIHERHPTVVHLSVHLENGQRVYFTAENAVQQAENPKDTTLTAFFNLCRTDEFAATLLYHQVPKFYTWNASGKRWVRRKTGQVVPEFPGIKCSDALGRVYTVHPNNSECFHLRMLLHEVTGPKSFADLKSVDGAVYETFKQACQLRGLLEDDAQWHRTLEEAAESRSPAMLRNLFAVMLQMCAMSDPLRLWELHKENMSEDYLHRARIQAGNPDMDFTDDIFNDSLISIEDTIRGIGGSDIQIFGLPEARRDNIRINYQLMRETSYDLSDLTEFIETNEAKLVEDQLDAYNKITSAVFNNSGGVFFLDAPGGTGKTFLINLILAKVRQRKMVALAVASSGIAATLLKGGKTAHSVFKLPINISSIESATCSISRNDKKAEVLKECRLIVWDECTMAHKLAVDAVDVTMQDLRHNESILGGAVLVMAGDFRQTLPVIQRGTKADEIQACIKKSRIWRHVRKLHLNTNMRVRLTGDVLGGEFANLLLRIGNGQVPCNEFGTISTHGIGINVSTIQQLKDSVFPNIEFHYTHCDWLSERAILAPRNDSADAINRQLLEKLPGTLHVYRSFDTVCDINDAVHYTPETLNNMEVPGVPPHKLQLKIGAPIMCLRNINPPALCNGTRLTVKKLSGNMIEATILTGQSRGEDVFIPRIPIIPAGLTVEFKRVQFPVRLSFAMTINKSQGQSLKVVGLDLQTPCFSHGQLYVGCSRVGDNRKLFILTPDSRTKNIVYPEVLDRSGRC